MEILPHDLQEYLDGHCDPEPEWLQSINRETYLKVLRPHMLSGHYQGRVLSFLSKLVHPERILEIGTFTGYATICLAEGLTEDGIIDTIEVYGEHNDADTQLIRNLNDKISVNSRVEKLILPVRDGLLRFKEDAIRIMHETGVPASIVLGVAMHESACGNSMLAQSLNNQFGVKGGPGSVIDFARIMTERSQFSGLTSTFSHFDYSGWAHGIQKRGYASSRSWASQVLGLIKKYQLYDFDENPADDDELADNGKKVATRNNKDVQKANSSSIATYTPLTSVQYIERYKAIAIQEMNLYGIPASITLAQGLFESGSGNGELARVANNHFGIKAGLSWQGRVYYKDDDNKNDSFRVYDRAEDSFRDHSEFLKKKNYSKLFELDKNDYKGWAYGLKKAGYATNPQYPTLLINIIQKYNLDQYDSPETELQKIKRVDTVLTQIDKKIYKAQKDSAQQYPNSDKSYTVKQGDTLYNISKRFGLTVDDLKGLNNLESNSIKIGQNKTVAGIIFDKENKARVASVNVQNITTGISIYNNLKGEFKIPAKPGDQLVFTRQDFHPDTVKEVTVHDSLLTPDQRLAATKADYTKIYGSLSYSDFLTTPSSGGAGLSIDALWNSLSRSGRNAEHLRGIIQQDYEQNFVDYRFNRTLVGNITGLKDEKLTEFMQRYRPGYYTTKNASDYEFISMIRANMRRFKRNKRTYILQPLEAK
eukprot:gene11284-11371_t